MGKIFTRKQFSDYLGEERGILDIITEYFPDGTPVPPPSPSPTTTPTPTPSSTCPTTTHYLKFGVTVLNPPQAELSIWLDPSFTVPANALCNYEVTGSVYSNFGGVKSQTQYITTGNHSLLYNYTPWTLSGETTVASMIGGTPTTSGCTCPVNLVVPGVTPTPTPTQTSTPTVTPTPTLTPTPSTPSGLFDIGNGFDTDTRSVLVGPGDTYYVFGTQYIYDGFDSRGGVKINNNGSPDTSFICRMTAGYNFIQNGVFDLDGNILIYGGFTQINGVSRIGIAKIDPNTGSVITSFNPTIGNTTINNIIVDENNDYYILGSFTSVNGSVRNRICKMDKNGVLYPIFTGTGFNNQTIMGAYDGSGGLYVVGQFTTFDGTSANRIVKLDTTTGLIDTSFNYGTGLSQTARGVCMGPSNHIYVSQILSGTYNTSTTGTIFKIRTDGLVDTGFNTVGCSNNREVVYSPTLGLVFTLCPLSSNGLIAKDENTGVINSSYTGSVNLNYRDTGGAIGVGIDSTGKIITTGNFTRYNNQVVYRIIRLNSDGTSNTITS